MGEGRRRDVFDPWRGKVAGGQYAFNTPHAHFVRLVPSRGKERVRKILHEFIKDSVDHPVARIIVNLDPDTQSQSQQAEQSGVRLIDLAHWLQNKGHTIDTPDMEGRFWAGNVPISLLRWEVSDIQTTGIPSTQTLERIVCAAIAAVQPDWGASVAAWLESRPDARGPEHKAHAWSYMAGWFAENGSEDFFRAVWRDEEIATHLLRLLRTSPAWDEVEALVSHGTDISGGATD